MSGELFICGNSTFFRWLILRVRLNRDVPLNSSKAYDTELTCLYVTNPNRRCLPLRSLGIVTFSTGPAYKIEENTFVKDQI